MKLTPSPWRTDSKAMGREWSAGGGETIASVSCTWNDEYVDNESSHMCVYIYINIYHMCMYPHICAHKTHLYM